VCGCNWPRVIGRRFVFRGSGHQLKRELASVTLDVNGLKLPFRVYEFSAGGQAMFVFYSVREDGTPAGVPGNMRESHRARFAAAWNGNRGLGQRVLEIALWGARDAEEAVELVRGELQKLVVEDRR
jgi:hypothetical protein